MIDWERYAKPADLERRLRPLMGQRPGDVQRFAASQRMEVSALIQNVVYASAPAPSRHPLIQATWLVEFRFNDNRLAAIHVERGLIGP